MSIKNFRDYVLDESFDKTYISDLSNRVNKALQDEISAAALYIQLSELTDNGVVASELATHADEEFNHYKSIIIFALNHKIPIKTTIDQKVFSNIPTDTKGILELVQSLEKIAIEDYRNITLLARKNDDLETESFFMELMKAEQGHFDDLSRYGEVRGI